MKTNRKQRVGRVTSNKMQKTVTVEVETRRAHPIYHKVMTIKKKFKAHDEKQECRPGDLVRIVEARPLSRDKRWRVVEVLTRAEVVEVPTVEEEVASVEEKTAETPGAVAGQAVETTSPGEAKQ